MSVAAMTLDDQRLNTYGGKMSKQYEQTVAGVESPDSPQYHHHHHHHHIQHIQDQPEPQQQQQQNAEQRMLEEEIENLKAEQGRLIQQCAEVQRREKILTRRLANKEQEFQDYVSQIAEYKAAQVPSALALRSALLDPAVNLLFEKLRKELKATKAKLEETQNELSAWKFTPDSNTGKRLMAKCRLLYQENEELGKMTSSGRLAKLETELAMQKSFSEEVKKSQSELDDFLQELDEDVEGMQSTILFLQQELKTTRERIQVLEKENFQLKNGIIEGDAVSASGGGDMATKNFSNQDYNNENNVNVELHAGLNGKSGTGIIKGNVSAADNRSIESYQQQQQQPKIHEQTEMNFQGRSAKETSSSSALSPIKEEQCIRISAYNCGSSDYYNGNADEQHHHQNLVAMQHNIDDGASCSKLHRTTRKRAYENVNECDSNIGNEAAGMAAKIATVLPIPISHVVPAPRTLPPKKSKLRMTPPTISQHNPMELSENESMSAINYGGVASINSAKIQQEHAMILDSSAAATSMINDNELRAPKSPDECPNIGGVAQRIMTRRRSMRTQQNGV